MSVKFEINRLYILRTMASWSQLTNGDPDFIIAGVGEISFDLNLSALSNFGTIRNKIYMIRKKNLFSF